MNWIDMLQLPAIILLVIAAVFVLFALMQVFACARCVRRRRPLAASWRLLLVLILLALGLLVGSGGMALRGYRFLGAEIPVVGIEARQLAPQQYALTLHWPDGTQREVMVHGDAWRLEAVVLKWELPAMLAGLPPLYRLDRLSGRYDDPAEALEAPRSVIDLSAAGQLDPVRLGRQYPSWLPMIDTVHGSGTYLPLVDGGQYEVRLMRSGALVARRL